jgi:hypothetical protein
MIACQEFIPSFRHVAQPCVYRHAKIFIIKKTHFSKLLAGRKYRYGFFDDTSWIKAEKLVFPSYISAKANGFLPKSYYEYIKASVFSEYSLVGVANASKRFYISRSRAKHRRVINEEQVIHLLDAFGFETVYLEELSFLEEVRLFQDAEMIVAPHGAGIASTVFSGKVKVLILYPNQRPTTFFFTQLQGLGQEHHFLCHDRQDEDDDFMVDLDKLKVMMDKLMLSKVTL